MKGHIRPRGPKRWQLVYDLPPSPDGKRRQGFETISGAKKDAQVRLREILKQLDSGIYATPGKITVQQLLKDYLESIKPDITPGSWRAYEIMGRRHITPLLGHLEAKKLTPLQIEAAYRELRARLAESTLSSVHSLLGAAMARGVKHRLVAVNPCLTVSPPKPRRAEAKALDQAQTAALLEAAKDTRLYAPIVLALSTGARAGELLGLRWEDIDFDRQVLSVRRIAQRLQDQGPCLVDRTKTRAGQRTITLPAIAIDVLKQHRIQQLNDKMRLRLVWHEPAGDLVFPDPLGGVWAPDALSQAFRRLVDRLGFDADIHLHSLRHTHASHLILGGVNPKIASARLGHARVAITQDVYAHLFADSQDQAAQLIDETLKNAIS